MSENQGYSFFLKSEKEVMQLPIPPSKLAMKINGKNKVIELLNVGDINILKAPGLTNISFEILLPGQKLPFATYPNGFKMPNFYLKRFKSYIKHKKIIRFIVTRIAPWDEHLFDTNMLVSLENYTIEEKAGEVGDIYVSLELKEYKEYSTQEIKMLDNENGKVTATVKKQRPAKITARTYTVKKSDTLWTIAKRELNDGSKYKEIAKLNNIKNPNKINPGQTLRLR